MDKQFEEATPNPEYLIKSIAEQGYSLETSLADLIDNSISAGANEVEVLLDMETEPFMLFIADNGNGMTKEELAKNMKFPSNSPENIRPNNDLGRFGLGLKTASFSQTRKLTVLSRKIGEIKYSGRTWDVDFLKENGWSIIINSDIEIDGYLEKYTYLSRSFSNGFEDFTPNTIVIWSGLYKFENYLDVKNRKLALSKEINEVTSDYLSLVFHRFLERNTNNVRIRLNNSLIRPFNPFPEIEKDFRQIEPKQSKFRSDVIKIEGFVLPSRSIKESANGASVWTTRFRGLMDMEGIYIYRADRIILFGGWNGIIKKAPRLQLARLRVEVGNSVDHLLHLNVAKSQIVIPHELRIAFENYIEELKIEAEREFYNRGIRKFSGVKSVQNFQLFEKFSSNKGSILEVNLNFPLIQSLFESCDESQKAKIKLILRMINNQVNDIRHVHEEKEFTGIVEKDGVDVVEIEKTIKELLLKGFSKEIIKEDVLPHLGFKLNSLPEALRKILS
jgi:hypothetical protein